MGDRLGRPLRDLRVSVTDRCNFRCPYCMPKTVFGRDHVFLPRAEILSFEEITRVVGAAAALGVTKVRLTGGEPLVRRDLERLVAMLAAVEGISDLALTTNGTLLAAKARALREAGLSRVTVSPPRIPCHHHHHHPAPSRPPRSGQARASGSTASYAWHSCACDTRLTDLHDVRSGGARDDRGVVVTSGVIRAPKQQRCRAASPKHLG